MAEPNRDSRVTVPEPRISLDGWLIGGGLALIGTGLVMIASASVATAQQELGDAMHYFWRQVAYVAIGLALAAAVTRVPVRAWERASPLLLVIGIGLLALVLVPGLGHEVNGSVRWIRLGPLNLQPSEPMKLFLVLYLAGYLVRRSDEVRRGVQGVLKPLAVTALVAVLLLLEPDYGGAAVLFVTALGMLFLAGVPLWSFSAWMALIAGLLGGFFLTAPYRMERLSAFLDPWADPFDSGFQLTQALIAVGRGELTGVGLGSGVQKLAYLPEAHTDFLFAVLAEELGLAGVALVILLFVLIIWRAFAIALSAEAAQRPYTAYVAYGIALVIGLQAFVNMAVNIGLLPTKGLALPLMSYGGSSLVVSCIALGLLLRMDHELRRAG